MAIAVLLLVVAAVQAIRRQATGPARPAAPTTTSSVAPPRTEDGAVITSCPSFDQQFPLGPLGCTQLSPPNLQAGERVPLVVLLHGFNTLPSQEIGNGHWGDAVVRRRFVLAAPESNAKSWNAGGCCGLSKSLGIDDVAHLRSLIKEMAAKPNIDPARIYLVGDSNGGMMTYRFLCSDANRLAGAASIEGTRVAGCTPSTPIPFLHVAGLADMTVPFEGGQSLAAWVLGVTFDSVTNSLDKFTTALDCGEPATAVAGNVSTTRWMCRGVPVQLVTLAGWGHAWPTPNWYPATDQVLDFFGIGA